jgi:hypothetical protein
MRKFGVLKTLLLGSAIAFITYSCEKMAQEKIDTETQSAVDNAISEGSFTQIFPVINEIGVNDDGVEKTTLADSNCYTVTHYGKDSVIVDFKNGCVDELGRLRKGIIKAVYNGRWKDTGSTVTVTFRGFEIDLLQYEGQVIFTHESSFKYSRKIQGGKLTHPDWTTLYEGYQAIEQIGGLASSANVKDTVHSDDVFRITGRCNGTNRKGLKYVSEITTPLIKYENCKWIGTGIYQLTPDSLEPRIINFGDGNCDNKATVTIKGKVYDFELK